MWQGHLLYIYTGCGQDCAVPVTMTINITDEIVPVFAQLGPYCLNATPDDLPLTSTNGITGTWNPATIATDVAGTFTYTFTPDAGQDCAVPVTMTINITDEIVPVFAQLGPYCLNATPDDCH